MKITIILLCFLGHFKLSHAKSISEEDENTMLEELREIVVHMGDDIQQLKDKIDDKLPGGSNDEENKPHNCQDILDQGYFQSGLYTIYIPGFPTCVPLTVYCDQWTDGGGWMVIQRRVDASVDFRQDWETYSGGFGDPLGNLYLGNKHIHELTNRGDMELRVDMINHLNDHDYAKYDHFSIGSEFFKYKLSVSGFHGERADRLAYHSGKMFSTKDQDNDINPTGHCSHGSGGYGWWFGACDQSLLNGPYADWSENGGGVHWNDNAGSDWRCLKFNEMKIRPKSRKYSTDGH